MEQFLSSLVGNALVVHVIMAAIPLFFILPYALVVIYLEMKIAAHMQDRVAYMRTGWHGTLQPIADMLKLLQKEDTIPAAADKFLFIVAPYIVFIGTYAAFAALPFSSAFIGSNINIGIFYIVAISSLVVVGLLMAGWASNNKWSLFGALRSAAQIVSYEIPSAFAILGVVMLAGTMSLQELSALQTGGIMHWMILGGMLPLMKKVFVIPLMLVLFVVYYISSMAEVNRTPFDIPEAESELVQGYNTELQRDEICNILSGGIRQFVRRVGGCHSPLLRRMGQPILIPDDRTLVELVLVHLKGNALRLPEHLVTVDASPAARRPADVHLMESAHPVRVRLCDRARPRVGVVRA